MKKIIERYIKAQFGASEAKNPSYDISLLADAISIGLIKKLRKEIKNSLPHNHAGIKRVIGLLEQKR
jgi:hypothetical protein